MFRRPLVIRSPFNRRGNASTRARASTRGLGRSRDLVHRLLLPGTMKTGAALLLLAAVGCTTTSVGRSLSPTGQAWLARHASTDVEADVAPAPEQPTERTQVVIQARSPTEVSFVARDGSVIPTDRVRKVVQVRRGLGALEGAAIGTGAGALIGALYGATRELSPYERSMDCALVCNHDDAAKLYGAMFGVIGVVVGTVVGAVVGDRDVLDLR